MISKGKLLQTCGVRHVLVALIFRLFYQVLSGIDRRIFSLYLANLLPYFVASGFLLETQREIEIVSLAPHYERVLLFLIGSVGLNFALEQQRSIVLGPHQQRDP